jgi:MFS family permease
MINLVQKKLKANIWKYFLNNLTNRRSYLPILSIYFLSLPNTVAHQIGIYTGIGWLVGFLLEIPSGYLSDIIGHKKTLVLAKFSMLFSTLFFVFSNSILFFILGSIFMAFGFAFTSGTDGAFLHNTLVSLKREKDYANIKGKISAKVSLISAGMILLLPILTKISLTMPIKAYLIFDIIGIVVAFSLFSPTVEYSAKDEKGEKLLSQLKRFKGTGFYTTSLFLGIIGAFILVISPFKELFVESLGLPIVYIGSIMALSRLIWFIVGHNLSIIKKIQIKKLLFYEIFFFSGLIIISSQSKNPYLAGILIAIMIGYYFGRSPIFDEYYLNNFLINKRYKATMLSTKQLISKLLSSGLVLATGIVMTISFNLGFLISGISMLIMLLIIYPFLKKYIK